MTVALDAGTYEVLRSRLREHCDELGRRAEALYDRRLSTSDGVELRLPGTERIRTENSCVPRDVARVGGAMLFGYNVFIGAAVRDDGGRRVRDARFRPRRCGVPVRSGRRCAGLLTDTGFQRDFAELYRYYQQAKLVQLRRIKSLLLAVFQTGPRADDLRLLRWRAGPTGMESYVDNSGERDHVFPPAKVEDNTSDGAALTPNRWPGRCRASRTRTRVRPDRSARPEPRPSVQRGWSAIPGLQHLLAGRGAAGRHRPGVPAAAGGRRHHLPGRLLPGDRSAQGLRRQCVRCGVRAHDPIGQRRGRPVRLHARMRGSYLLLPYSTSPSGSA